MMNRLSESVSDLWATLLGIIKVVLLSRHTRMPHVTGGTINILGNGPSLRDVLDSGLPDGDRLAVNFAANDESFFTLQPQYYSLIDPHFFTGRESDPNVERLYSNLNRVDWPMTLFVPAGRLARRLHIDNRAIRVVPINCVGVDGYRWLQNIIYNMRLGMPRPRNVLIPSLMAAIWMGYKKIRIYGADHSWTRTLWVDDDNRVMSVQPHFYKDNELEHQRVTSVYSGLRLHQVLGSFAVAFRSYHDVRQFADHCGVDIINCTKGSFIDAFRRQ